MNVLPPRYSLALAPMLALAIFAFGICYLLVFTLGGN